MGGLLTLIVFIGRRSTEPPAKHRDDAQGPGKGLGAGGAGGEETMELERERKARREEKSQLTAFWEGAQSKLEQGSGSSGTPD